jgi:hypothetical protein
MAGRIPRSAKPPGQLRRRNRPEEWVVLPRDGCTLPVPRWPNGKPSKDEAVLWQRLWKAPVAALWHEQAIDASVVARYVELRFAKPGLAALSRIEGELGLTPAALLRMRLVVEQPEPAPEPVQDPYAHLRAEYEAAAQ